MADQKEKYKSFQNISYGNNFSNAIKLFEIWVTDALKCEKENDIDFPFNDIAPIIIEICVSYQESKFLKCRKNLLQLEAYNLIENETPPQVFSCKFCEIF